MLCQRGSSRAFRLVLQASVVGWTLGWLWTLGESGIYLDRKAKRSGLTSRKHAEDALHQSDRFVGETYFFLRRLNTCSDCSCPSSRASPSTHSPFRDPPKVQGPSRTFGLFLIRLAFPVLESDRMKSSPFSSANQTGVRTPTPVFRKVSTQISPSLVRRDRLSAAVDNDEDDTVGRSPYATPIVLPTPTRIMLSPGLVLDRISFWTRVTAASPPALIVGVMVDMASFEDIFTTNAKRGT